MNDLIIRVETEKDYETVEALTREAFWNVYRPGAAEHYLVHTMRHHPDFIPSLDFVLEADGAIAGVIQYTRAWLVDEAGARREILSLALLGIAPAYQRRGLGRRLIEHSMAVAREMGYDVITVLGNPANYVGRGFVSCRRKNISFAEAGYYPTALLVCELVQGALDGRAWMYVPSTADEACADDAAVEAFDARFPRRERAWMPSQEEFYIYSHSAVVR